MPKQLTKAQFIQTVTAAAEKLADEDGLIFPAHEEDCWTTFIENSQNFVDSIPDEAEEYVEPTSEDLTDD